MKLISASLLAILALTGCGGVPEKAVQKQPSQEERFLAVARDVDPSLEEIPDDVVVGAANEACALFEKGYTPDEVHLVMTGVVGLSDTTSGTLMAGATEVYCPAFKPQVERWGS